MESAYALANRELARRRQKNRNIEEQRREEVRTASPEYARIERELARSGAALARCVLENGENFETVKSGIQQLQRDKLQVLKELGHPADYLEPLYDCPLCKDTGYDNRGLSCVCFRQLVAQNLGRNANLTGRMAEQTFEKADYSLFSGQPSENGRSPLVYIKRAYAIGREFADTFDRAHTNLLLMGNAGTGKSYLSGCIANRALARGKSVYYQTAFRLFDMMEKLKFSRISSEDLDDAEFTAKYIYSAELLIIDDLGTEFISSYSTALLFDLINSRQLAEKSTILSTNLTMSGLEELYSKRLTSRFAGDYTIIPFIGQDLRMSKFRQGE